MYPFWGYGIATLLISLTVFLYILSLRLYKRKMNRIIDLNSKIFDAYYLALFFTYAVIITLGVVWWSVVKEHLILFSCLFLPIIYECLLVIFYNWSMNDYKILANVAEYNKKMKKFKEEKLL